MAFEGKVVGEERDGKPGKGGEEDGSKRETEQRMEILG